jgi:membrane associated rhomboid family serine protease
MPAGATGGPASRTLRLPGPQNYAHVRKLLAHGEYDTVIAGGYEYTMHAGDICAVLASEPTLSDEGAARLDYSSDDDDLPRRPVADGQPPAADGKPPVQAQKPQPPDKWTVRSRVRRMPGWARPPAHRRNRTACAAVIMLSILAVIWIVQFANVADHYALDPEFGIQPHLLASLPDIFSAPFLHMSWSHIEGNSVPLFVLGFLAAYKSLVKFAFVTVLVIMTSGLFVWLTAPVGSYTVGASAVIAGWLGYVMLRGFFDHRISDIVIGVIAGLVYLGAFEFLPNNENISWQGHLSGLIAGMSCAWLFRTREPNSLTRGRGGKGLEGGVTPAPFTA